MLSNGQSVYTIRRSYLKKERGTNSEVAAHIKWLESSCVPSDFQFKVNICTHAILNHACMRAELAVGNAQCSSGWLNLAVKINNKWSTRLELY